MDASDVPRVAQLIAKTNQFTLNAGRRTPAEVAGLLGGERYVTYVVSASDRFGDYGTIGAFIIDKESPAIDGTTDRAVLDTFVLSCRAMGREIETAMLAAACDAAGQGLCVSPTDTPRNHPARAFFARHGCADVGRLSQVDPPQWPAHVARIGSEQLSDAYPSSPVPSPAG
jgi:FkbH-like protein